MGFTCDAKTSDECFSCRKWNSMHSEHFDRARGERVSTVNCSIGGYLIFNEDGDLIEKD